MEHLINYFLAFMCWAYPLQNHAQHEGEDVTLARYTALASAVAEGISEPYVRPLFRGPGARARTGLVLLATARYESGGYVGDVTDCVVAGDKGKSWGPFQTQRNPKRACWSDLGAVGVALEMMHESFRIVGGPDELRLAEYTDGLDWKTSRAGKRSRTRVGLALRYWREHSLEGTD